MLKLIIMNPFDNIQDKDNEINMNPFDNILERDNTLKINDEIIEIWVENRGRKSDTYLQGWNISLDELKEHLKNIKRNKGCNGSIKTQDPDDDNLKTSDNPKQVSDNSKASDNSKQVSDIKVQYILQLQGNHKFFLQTYLVEHGILSENIKIKG